MGVFALKARVYGDARDISLREILFGGGDQLPGDTATAGVLRNNQRQNASAEIICAQNCSTRTCRSCRTLAHCVPQPASDNGRRPRSAPVARYVVLARRTAQLAHQTGQRGGIAQLRLADRKINRSLVRQGETATSRRGSK